MKLRYLLALYAILFLVLFVVVLNNSIGFNPLSNELDMKESMVTTIPQGWAFFTRNPREGQALLYKLDGEVAMPADFKHSNLRFFLGLNRSCTKIYTELGYIRQGIPDSLFTPVEWNYQSTEVRKIDAAKLRVFHSQAPLKDNKLQGEYLLILQEPIPWAWSSSIAKQTMPAQAVILTIH